MKIITVNLPISYLKTMDGLIKEYKIYPSRSELIRVAIREFLMKELEAAQDPQEAADKEYVQAHANSPEQKAEIDQSLVIRVPAGKIDEDGIYKMYRIVKK